MRLSRIGIIVVFCLQLAYVTYTAIYRPAETFVAVNNVTSGTNPVAYATDISTGAEFLNADVNRVNNEEIVSTPDRRTHKRLAGAILVSRKISVKVPAETLVNKVPQFTAMQWPSDGRLVIEYPRAMPLDTQSVNDQHSARAVPQSKKRSIFSKSVSVLKKPYDWLKALGSKLN